jgi:hypothetical protein
MARPIGVKSYLITESVENGATNRSKGVFRIYSQLKLALSLSGMYWNVKNTKIIEVNCIHHVIRMQSLLFNNLCIGMP